MFAFELWREFKLSIAEISKVYNNPQIEFVSKEILIISWVEKQEIINKAKNLWWTIKIIEVNSFNLDFEEILDQNLVSPNHEWKFNYAINQYGKKITLKDVLKVSKKIIKDSWFNPRFINQDFKNISSVAIIKEALVKKETDFNFIFTDDITYFGKTIFVQDIYGYSNRDYWKLRDMNIGMLPPKLAQMMINLTWWEKIYDPFVGLGTVLIESIYMWNKEVFGSDLNERMVETSNENLDKLKDKFQFKHHIFKQNAKYINELDIWLNNISIATEWYLWEVMTKNNINYDRILKQREKLADLYEWFFSGLKKLKFNWKIVISFPFWEIKGKYFYFEEIYDIIWKYCKVSSLLPENIEFLPTKAWSLLYKRDSQLVWREVFCLEIK